MLMAVEEITEKEFENEVLKSEMPVVVDFYAQWCGPCKMMAPITELLAKEMASVKFVKVDVDENPELSAQYGIMSIPTIVLFKKGKEAERNTGALPKDMLKKWIEENRK